jgi:hypothetical protein
MYPSLTLTLTLNITAMYPSLTLILTLTAMYSSLTLTLNLTLTALCIIFNSQTFFISGSNEIRLVSTNPSYPDPNPSLNHINPVPTLIPILTVILDLPSNPNTDPNPNTYPNSNTNPNTNTNPNPNPNTRCSSLEMKYF